MSIGGYIRLQRKYKGLTLRELADKTGLSHSYLSQLELGDRKYSFKSLKALADALDISYRTLLEKAGLLEPDEYEQEQEQEQDTSVSVGERIKQARNTKGYTLAELGERVSLTHGYLSNIENGNRQPSPDVLKRLATILGVSYAALLHDAGYRGLAQEVGYPEEALNESVELVALLDGKYSDSEGNPFSVMFKGRELTPKEIEKVKLMLKLILE